MEQLYKVIKGCCVKKHPNGHFIMDVNLNLVDVTHLQQNGALDKCCPYKHLFVASISCKSYSTDSNVVGMHFD